MNIPLLGSLRPHRDFPQWLVSLPVPVPYFNGERLAFTLENFTDRDEPEVDQAIYNFFELDSEDRTGASPMFSRITGGSRS
jgi:hypothetical protein